MALRPLLFAALTAFITPTQAGLLAAWEDAQRNDPTYQMAIAQRDADIEDKNLALAQLLPQVSASAAQGQARSDITTNTSAFRKYNTESWALQLRQSLFRVRAIASYAQGKAVAKAADATLAAARQTLAIKLIEASAGLAQAAADLKAVETTIITARQIVTLSGRQLKAGEMTRADQAKASARLARALQEKSQTQTALAVAEATWQGMTGP